MKTATLAVALSGLILVGSGCGSPKVRADKSVTANGVTTKLDWIKKKMKGIDLQITMTNSHSDPLILANENFSLTFKGQPAPLDSRDGDSRIQANKSSRQLLVFRTPQNKDDGDVVLTIDGLRLMPADKKPQSVPTMKIDVAVKSPI